MTASFMEKETDFYDAGMKQKRLADIKAGLFFAVIHMKKSALDILRQYHTQTQTSV